MSPKYKVSGVVVVGVGIVTLHTPAVMSTRSQSRQPLHSSYCFPEFLWDLLLPCLCIFGDAWQMRKSRRWSPHYHFSHHPCSCPTASSLAASSSIFGPRTIGTPWERLFGKSVTHTDEFGWLTGWRDLGICFSSDHHFAYPSFSLPNTGSPQ